MRMDISNQRYGRLVALEIDKIRTGRRTFWKCLCDCGNEKSVTIAHLRNGSIRSCGCYRKEKTSETFTTHGGKGTSLYHRWKAMKQRCLNSNNLRYQDYGQRGIDLCVEWENFENFKQWAFESGYQENLSLDRIDNNKGYYADNCHWVSVYQNNSNRRNTVRVEGLTLREIANTSNIEYSRVHYVYYVLIKKIENVTIQDILNY